MLTSQPFEKQQHSYEVFEKRHDMECTTLLLPFSAACGPTQGYLFPPCFMVFITPELEHAACLRAMLVVALGGHVAFPEGPGRAT